MANDTAQDNQDSNPSNSLLGGIEIPPMPEEPPTSLLAGLGRVIRSSKAIVVLGSIAAMTVLVVYGKITSDLAVETIKWLVIAFIGATAVEDGAMKLSQTSKTTAASSPTKILWVLQQLIPLILSIIEGTKKTSPASMTSDLSPEAEQAIREAEEMIRQQQQGTEKK